MGRWVSPPVSVGWTDGWLAAGKQVDLKTHHHFCALFLQGVYAIEKSLAGFNVQPRIDMNRS